MTSRGCDQYGSARAARRAGVASAPDGVETSGWMEEALSSTATMVNAPLGVQLRVQEGRLPGRSQARWLRVPQHAPLGHREHERSRRARHGGDHNQRPPHTLRVQAVQHRIARDPAGRTPARSDLRAEHGDGTQGEAAAQRRMRHVGTSFGHIMTSAERQLTEMPSALGAIRTHDPRIRNVGRWPTIAAGAAYNLASGSEHAAKDGGRRYRLVTTGDDRGPGRSRS
jgi:hypothetical protein